MAELKQIGAFKLLPPAKDCCQVCAVKHSPDQPHNKQSLYYQVVFENENGRAATWADAMAHCSDEVKQKWTVALLKKGLKID